MHVEKRSLDFLVRRVNQMNDSHVTTRSRGRFRYTVRSTIIKDLKINEMDQNIVYHRTLLHNLIH